ncbi:MAG: fluoride efflux transporter CrcB [Salinivirgaceae bacterium]|nr:fluoride efflux transporter CrcB [Salinivirgaceae bacterium]
MIKTILLIGSGGFVGSVLRYFVQQWFVQLSDSKIPWGTFTANILGSLIIGIIYAFVEKQGYFSQELRLLFAVGFCGGFTTFSSFAAENFQLIKYGDFLSFAIYTSISVISGLLAVWAGMMVVKTLS